MLPHGTDGNEGGSSDLGSELNMPKDILGDKEVGELWHATDRLHTSLVVDQLIRKLVEERTQRHFSTVTYRVDCKLLALSDFGIDPSTFSEK